uniref:Ovule protein n=1 Tax=Mesocestoides corti TaxID=53468 RepID=A0A5K3FY62_MESCO
MCVMLIVSRYLGLNTWACLAYPFWLIFYLKQNLRVFLTIMYTIELQKQNRLAGMLSFSNICIVLP